ncbi:glucose-6-phosphate isomerase [Wohlfahrtiimonas chitiniclastica]|uniref:Glucose-6-phosphate isomerase n=1 Tax=Wohlfahrtiimonas chitiniclastica TaxID=400946 RepID=A0AB35C063_9GAMM|nr:glucose-6-phosphate isomerase [Wohlfahrtiimonas chitiniclastica]MBS7824738.1 glucose-6-phosphate isomerase [Wohlfahrtiimonas chitiniclastica]MBS7840428.1 glucose-6-phosphate isomerase [Wohlfahrtiimonas chitiniclastica]
MKTLKELAEQLKRVDLSTLFANDPTRFDDFSRTFDGLLLDFSKQRLTLEVLDALEALTVQHDLQHWMAQLFSDQPINETEQRAAMHWALRVPQDDAKLPHINEAVHAQLDRMSALVNKIHAGQCRGATGEVITDVVNIGVGGSDLGPLMVTHALSDFKVPTAKSLNMHFVSTMDGSQLSALLHQLRPETTLFIISSKSFGTIDTLSNAQTVRVWLEKALGHSEQVLKNHFVGVSTNVDKMTAWGIHPDHQLLLWDWVGGRYSLWSCIGLPIALTIGVAGFQALLAGAHAMDEHFRTAPFKENLPMLLAMIGIWNANHLNIQTHAVLPYDGRLKYFAAYLQQLEMESNGKSVQRNGEDVAWSTCPIVWGEVGPNAQHAFYQLLHQGTHAVSCDFIAPIERYTAKQFTYAESESALIEQHHLALANCLAQSRLLAFGSQSLSQAELANLPKYQYYAGNQPSSTLLMDELNPRTLGMLIALYEHKVFVQSVIWRINPFDQWGVEKGKAIANQILPILAGQSVDSADLDGSTQGLLQRLMDKNYG